MILKERGLHGVEFVVSDNHNGPKKAIAECLSGAAWQRRYVHFLRNAIDHLPRKLDAVFVDFFEGATRDSKWRESVDEMGEAPRAEWHPKYAGASQWHGAGTFPARPVSLGFESLAHVARPRRSFNTLVYFGLQKR